MRTLFLISILLWSILYFVGTLNYDPQITYYNDDPGLMADRETAISENDQDDPAYPSYKNAYADILREDWQRAFEKMEKIVNRFPESSLKDDAEYWSAYALSFLDKDRALSSYQNFIKHNRGSRYYTDAIADLAELKIKDHNKSAADWHNRQIKVYVKNNSMIEGEGIKKIKINTDKIVIGDGPESLIVGNGKITIRGDGNSYSYSYNISSNTKSMERVLRYHTRRLNRLSESSERIDPKHITKRREINVVVDAGEIEENEDCFLKLKNIVLDSRQPLDTRETALINLSAFKNIDVVPVFIDVAKRDTSEDIQFMVVDILSNNEKPISVLIDLFNSIPNKRKQQREMVFYRIAENGGDEAIDFLEKIAVFSEEVDLKNQAIYFLGSIGGPKAREALSKILNEK